MNSNCFGLNGGRLESNIKLSKEDKLKVLEEMITRYENLPQAAMYASVNHFDLYCVLLMMKSLFSDG